MKKTVLIDADSLIYFEMNKPTLEEAIAGIDDRMTTMLAETKATDFAGFLTVGRCFRYNRAETRDYKGNRKKTDRPIIFYALKEYLQQTWKCTYITEVEADDLVCMYADTENGTTVVCSPDKDVLYQLPGSHYNYRTAEWIHTSKQDAEKFLWKQMLMGDPTDGIPGIPKVGEKTASLWLADVTIIDMPEFVLNKYIEKFGTHEGILKFTETFRLVYILKTEEDLERETGIKLPELVKHAIETNQPPELWP
tara:strand:- start:1057 stop:1809 length:753 start_codon:yes stop_codon:yes gene_type:complete